ncbi:MAG: tRNA (adenine(22)-N(1))-methyltransferase TrmK [Lachnospiraceae bacterium]|nr:tRNA (adenine(22)-N(1))-methyltransferase TrmK [Lachnospiraceae bacterium]
MRSGWRIVREDMVFEEGKYYPMMKAKRLPPMDVHEREHSGESGRDHSRAPGREYSGKHSAGYSQAELAFGPELLRMRHPVLCQYLRKERKTQERILESLEKGQGEKAAARVREIQNQICLIDEALNRYFSD